MQIVLRDGPREVALRVETGPSGLTVHVNGSAVLIDAWSFRDGRVWFASGGMGCIATVARDGERRLVHVDGDLDREFAIGPAPRRAIRRGGKSAPDQLAASMHSQVVVVAVKVGAVVARGETLIVLEAMKMETRIASPHAGKIVALNCAVGDVVERGRVLIEVEPAE